MASWWSQSAGFADVPLADNCENHNKFSVVSGPDHASGGVLSTVLFAATVSTCSFSSLTFSVSVPVTGGFDAIFVQVVSIAGLELNSVDMSTLKVQQGTGTALSITSGLPSVPDEMVWGLWMFDGPVTPYIVGKGCTGVLSGEAVSFGEYKNISTAEPQILAGASGNPAHWIAYAIGFKIRTS